MDIGADFCQPFVHGHDSVQLSLVFFGYGKKGRPAGIRNHFAADGGEQERYQKRYERREDRRAKRDRGEGSDRGKQ